MSSHPLYHLHRQNQFLKIRKPIFRSRFLRILDKIALIAGVLAPFFAGFQSFEIWSTQNADSVALVAWLAPMLFNIPLFIYGLAHRVKLMMIVYSLWFVVNLSIVVGVLLFG